MEALIEVISLLILGISDFFKGIYKLFLETTVTTFLDFFNLSYDEFATYGIEIVDSFFSKFNFTSEKFTDNFLYFFIGLLFFAMFIKIMFKLLSFLVSNLISTVSSAFDAAKQALTGLIPFL